MKSPNEATLAGLAEFRRLTSRPVEPKPKPVVVSAGAGLEGVATSDWFRLISVIVVKELHFYE